MSTENQYPIDVKQLWEYANNSQQVGFNGGYYYIETITQDFYPNIPRLVVILFCETERLYMGRNVIERIEVTKKEDLDKISFPVY
jgi:hypothetical protein